MVQNVPGRTSMAQHEIVFLAEDLQPLQRTQFCVQIQEGIDKQSKLFQQSIKYKNKDWNIFRSSNGKLFHFNTTSNGLFKLEKTDNAGRLKVVEFTQQYFYYTGYKSGSRPSGAYVFRPTEEASTPLGEPTTSQTFEGDIFYEIHQTFFQAKDNKHVSQVIRIPRENSSFLYDVEIEWMVGPIPIEDGQGKEYIHRIHVNDLANNEIFYTDANGRQYVKRRRNVRPDFDVPEVEIQEPVSSNYYPITSSIYMENEENQLRLTVLTDRSQGGGSIR